MDELLADGSSASATSDDGPSYQARDGQGFEARDYGDSLDSAAEKATLAEPEGGVEPAVSPEPDAAATVPWHKDPRFQEWKQAETRYKRFESLIQQLETQGFGSADDIQAALEVQRQREELLHYQQSLEEQGVDEVVQQELIAARQHAAQLEARDRYWQTHVTNSALREARAVLPDMTPDIENHLRKLPPDAIGQIAETLAAYKARVEKAAVARYVTEKSAALKQHQQPEVGRGTPPSARIENASPDTPLSQLLGLLPLPRRG
jgi:hypothetical protein